MAQFPCEVFGISLSAGHNGCADTDVDEHQHKILALPRFQLVQRQSADIVFQIGRHIQRFGQKLADFHPVPAFKPGRVQNPAIFAVQRARGADTDTQNLVPFHGFQYGFQLRDDGQIVLLRNLSALKQIPGHITQAHTAALSGQIHCQCVIAVGAQSKGCGAAAPAHGLRGKLCHNSQIPQVLHNQGGGRPGQTRGPGQLCPAHGVMPQDAQDRFAVIFFCVVCVAWFLRHIQSSPSFVLPFCPHYTVSRFFCQFA